MLIITFLRQHQTIIHKIGLFLTVILQIIIAFGLQIPRDIANAMTFSILSYILFDISQNTYNFKKHKVYEQQEDMYRDIMKYIEEKPIKTAILIQYSGHRSISLIDKLIRKNAEITVYLQHPEDAINQWQKERIQMTIENLRRCRTTNKLTIYGYDVPASIKGVLINEELLAVGWYAYGHTHDDDEIQLSGHSIAGMLFHKGSDEYEIFKTMFMKQAADFEKHCKLNHKTLLKLP
jgi:hypothetical protein